MQIIINNELLGNFGAVSIGDAFKFGDDYYIRTALYSDKYNAISLNDFRLTCFSDDTTVAPVQATLTIGG